MLDLKRIQELAELTDKMDISIADLEKFYNQNNAEKFTKTKKDLMDIQNKIARLVQ